MQRGGASPVSDGDVAAFAEEDLDPFPVFGQDGEVDGGVADPVLRVDVGSVVKQQLQRLGVVGNVDGSPTNVVRRLRVCSACQAREKNEKRLTKAEELRGTLSGSSRNLS